MKEFLIGLGGAVLGAGVLAGVGWYLLTKDMEKWW